MALTELERETTVSFNDADDTAYIYTAQRKVITKLKRNSAVKILEEGTFEGTAWLKCEMPAHLIGFRNPPKLTEEQRANRSRTMQATRARQLGLPPYKAKK
jgi:hypothetical protein